MVILNIVLILYFWLKTIRFFRQPFDKCFLFYFTEDMPGGASIAPPTAAVGHADRAGSAHSEAQR